MAASIQRFCAERLTSSGEWLRRSLRRLEGSRPRGFYRGNRLARLVSRAVGASSPAGLARARVMPDNKTRERLTERLSWRVVVPCGAVPILWSRVRPIAFDVTDPQCICLACLALYLRICRGRFHPYENGRKKKRPPSSTACSCAPPRAPRVSSARTRPRRRGRRRRRTCPTCGPRSDRLPR